jgi:hypothetical protein
MKGPFSTEKDGDFIWITDVHGYCIARLQWRFPGYVITQFTSDEVVFQADFICNAMNDAWEEL